MKRFAERLKELMIENHVDAKTLAAVIHTSPTIIYQWQKSNKGISLGTAVKLADYFKCSIDYLMGRVDEYNGIDPKSCPPFGEQLKKVLTKKKVSQYRILKETDISRGNLNSWFHNKSMPNMESVITLADYLDVSIDYLVGREP